MAESEEAAYIFFQAEDGIRDLTVTGVQTCALPIWRPAVGGPPPRRVRDVPLARLGVQRHHGEGPGGLRRGAGPGLRGRGAGRRRLRPDATGDAAEARQAQALAPARGPPQARRCAPTCAGHLHHRDGRREPALLYFRRAARARPGPGEAPRSRYATRSEERRVG